MRRRLKSLWNLPQLIGGDDIGVDEQWQILHTLYDCKPIISATIAVFLASCMVWHHHFPIYAGLWTLSAVIVAAGRIMLSRRYAARSESDVPQLWITRSFIALAVTGVQWGLGGLILANANDGSIASAVFAVEAALMAGAAARTYCFPIATIVQVNVTALLIATLSLFAGEYVYVFLMVIYGYYQTNFIRLLARNKLKEIASEQQRQALLAALERTNEELASANTRLRDISLTDALTGIGNRRSFERELGLRWERAVVTRGAVSLLMIDVDHFKRFNDAHGHPAGDKCLALVAAAIKSAAPSPPDHAARYGGEEFTLILPDADLDEATVIAERVAAAVRSISVPVDGDLAVAVTVSIGIGYLRAEDGTALSLLISLADQALYGAKQDGRDCVRSGQSHQLRAA